MDEEVSLWREWAARCRRYGLAGPLSLALEGLDPLLILGAQFLYLGQPLISLAIPRQKVAALAHLLEAPEARTRFRNWLQE